VDRDGHAVSLTTTLGANAGARLMTRSGFLLNNSLATFSFAPEINGKPVANRVEGGKRPRSSMAPTMVFDRDGKLVAVVGSAWGSHIILYVAKILVALLDWKMDPQQAVDFPNFGSRNGPTELEARTAAAQWRTELEALGHDVKIRKLKSGAQAILVTPEGLSAGSDSRRDGVALGD